MNATAVDAEVNHLMNIAQIESAIGPPFQACTFLFRFYLLLQPRPCEDGREALHGFRGAQMGLPERSLVSVIVCIHVFNGFSSARHGNCEEQALQSFRRLEFIGYAHNNLALALSIHFVCPAIAQLWSHVRSAFDGCGDSGVAGLDRMDA